MSVWISEKVEMTVVVIALEAPGTPCGVTDVLGQAKHLPAPHWSRDGKVCPQGL